MDERHQREMSILSILRKTRENPIEQDKLRRKSGTASYIIQSGTHVSHT